MLPENKLEVPVDIQTPPGVAVTPDSLHSRSHNSLRDEALDFLEEHKNAAAVSLSRDAAFTRTLRKKIDFRIAIVLWLAYTLCFIDKVLLNYAKIMGMTTQLHLVGNDYSNASASFYISSLIFSVPNIWVLNRFPAGKYLAVNLIGWGICNACHAALKNYAGLVTLRVLGGAFESGVIPTLILIVSQYFNYEEQAPRMAIWYTGMGTGQIFGGLISFAFQYMSIDAELSGWRTMFLTLGLVSVLFGVFILFYMPDTPMSAKFLTKDEKVVLLEHVKVNQTGIENKHFHPSQLIEGVLDIGCWLLYLSVILELSGSGVVSSYSATLLTSFGYSPQISALLNIPSGAVNIISTLVYAVYVRYYGQRYLVVFVATIIGLIGASLLSFLPSNNKAGLLAALYLINAFPGCGNIVYQWMSCNVAGHTKRAYAMAMMNAAYSIGNIIGPETFRAQDAPEYKPAKLSLVACWAVGGVIALGTGWYYNFMNKLRSREMVLVEGEEVDDEQAYAGLTDKQNKAFRYHL